MVIKTVYVCVGWLKTRKDNARPSKLQGLTTWDQVGGVDSARTFGIDHSDKCRSHCFCRGLLFNFFLCKYLLFCTIAGEQCVCLICRSTIQPAGNIGGSKGQQTVNGLLLCPKHRRQTSVSCSRYKPWETLHQDEHRQVISTVCVVMYWTVHSLPWCMVQHDVWCSII